MGYLQNVCENIQFPNRCSCCFVGSCFVNWQLCGHLNVLHYIYTCWLHCYLFVKLSLTEIKNIFLLLFPSFPSRPVCWRRIFQCKDGYVLLALYLHQFHSSESHWASGGEALNMGPASCRYFPRFKCSLSVHCSQTAPLHWPQFHSQRPVCRTVYMMVPLF